MRSRNDEGAVLIFALIITTTIALVVGALLTRGDGSLRATVALRQVAGTSYAADAAANVAINDLRTGNGFTSGGFDNSPGTLLGCFGHTLSSLGDPDGLSLNGFYPGSTGATDTSAYVQCAGEHGTGQDGSPVPISDKNHPGFAIITLNGDIASASNLAVHGGVYSNGAITGPVVLDAGDAWANGSCTQTTVTASATKHCNSGSTLPDPNDCGVATQAATCHGYDSDLGGTVPTLQTPPTTCTAGYLAIFTPGYYDDAAAMNAATSRCSTVWFKPGAYYFDFHNDGCATVCPANLFPTGSSDQWTIPRGVSVVGGTPIDAAGNVLARPPDNPSMPGACESPVTSTTAVGVQFVFGYNSHLYLAGGGSQGAHTELCASYHADRPPIELYGLKSGTTPAAASANALKTSATPAPTGSGAGTWTNVTAAALSSADGVAATWATTGNGTKTGTLTMSGFAPVGSIPVGSVLTGATLHVTHKEVDTNASTATLQVTGASAATPPLTLPTRTTSGTDNIDLTTVPAVFNSLQKQVHDYGYAGARLTYNGTVKTNGSNSETVDAVSFDLTYAVPVLRGEAGTCVQGGASPCKLLALDPSGNNKIQLYLQGTTYTPYGDVDLTLSNFSAEVAMFGVVARQVEFTINTGNPSYHGPVFQIPDNSPGYGYENSTVDLKVYVCAASPTCAPSGTPALTARVQLWDPSGSPAPPARQVTVLSWSHSR